MRYFAVILMTALLLAATAMPQDAVAGFNFFPMGEKKESPTTSNKQNSDLLKAPTRSLPSQQQRTKTQEKAIQPTSPATQQQETTSQRPYRTPAPSGVEAGTDATVPQSQRGLSSPQPRRNYGTRTVRQADERPIITRASTPSNPVRVGLLLPLSGRHEAIGKALLQSAEMALFQIAPTNLILVVRDTKGTPEGAEIAAMSALEKGAEILLGPLFSESAKVVGPIAEEADTPVVTFSTDWTVANDYVYVMGFLPFNQVDRITRYAIDRGYQQFAALVPVSPYGTAVAGTLEQVLQTSNLPPLKLGHLTSDKGAAGRIIREFSEYDQRRNDAIMALDEEDRVHYIGRMKETERAALLQRARERDREERELNMAMPEITGQGDQLAAEIDQIAQGQQPGGRQETEEEKGIPELFMPAVSYNAVLLPFGGSTLYSIASLLKRYDVNTREVQFLGTGLWDEPTISQERALHRGWYAAPDPSARQNFLKQYRDNFGSEPPRIATLAYDAVALSAVLAYQGLRTIGAPNYNREALTNPVGFAGIDGIFRFSRNTSLIERGLAVLEVNRRGTRVIDPAPRQF